MTDTLSPEAIAYMVEWKRSGNEPRSVEEVCREREELIDFVDSKEGGLVPWYCQMSPVGLTVVAQAERIEELESDVELVGVWFGCSEKEVACLVSDIHAGNDPSVPSRLRQLEGMLERSRDREGKLEETIATHVERIAAAHAYCMQVSVPEGEYIGGRFLTHLPLKPEERPEFLAPNPTYLSDTIIELLEGRELEKDKPPEADSVRIAKLEAALKQANETVLHLSEQQAMPDPSVDAELETMCVNLKELGL